MVIPVPPSPSSSLTDVLVRTRRPLGLNLLPRIEPKPRPDVDAVKILRDAAKQRRKNGEKFSTMAPDEVLKQQLKHLFGESDSQGSEPDAAGAAAMIEALPPDMAVGVMMNTPDDRAREVLAHTKNRSLKERVANRATMALEACDVDLRDESGANFRAIAGERFTFKVISRESGGTRINHGGAHLTAIITLRVRARAER